MLTIFPTLLEVVMVTSIIWYNCGVLFATVTFATIVAYSSWTLGITSWRTKYRIKMNKADNKIGNIAHDSLLNYETVKVYVFF